MSTKAKANNEIVDIITHTISRYPDLRFGQILVGLNLTKSEKLPISVEKFTVPLDTVDFNENPEVMLERIKQSSMFKALNEKPSFKGVF